MTVTDYINTYELPENLGIILKAVIAYKGIDINKVDIKIAPQLPDENGGTNFMTGTQITIVVPAYDRGGRVPVNTIVGNNEKGDARQTYIQYDYDLFAYVHEINHSILEILGLNSDANTELYIAVMAEAARVAIQVGVEDQIKIAEELQRLLTSGWNTETMKKIAQQDNASFENEFATSKSFLSTTGLSNISDVYRRGYGIAKDWGDGKGFSSQIDFVGLAWLGNKENNVMTGGDFGDYLDGGIGNDTLVGGSGSDGLIGGAGDDTLMRNVQSKNNLSTAPILSDIDTKEGEWHK